MSRSKICFQAELPIIKMALPAIVTIMTGKLLFELYFPEFPRVNGIIQAAATAPAPSSDTTHLQELNARLFWMGSALLYLFVNCAVLLFLRQTNQLNPEKKPSGLIFLLLTLFIVESGYLLIRPAENSPLKTIYHFTFDLILQSAQIDPQVIDLIPSLMHSINFASIFIPLYAIYTASRLASGNKDDLEGLAIQLTKLNDLIRAASVLMISGIIHMELWLHWPLHLAADFPDFEALKNLLRTIIKYWGICYTLTIAALYIPLAQHLKQQAVNLCQRQHIFCETANLPDWLGENPLRHSLTTQLPQLIAILGPVLAGTLAPGLTNVLTF